MIRALIFDCFGVLFHGSIGHLRELTPPDDQPALQDLRIAYDRGYISLSAYHEGLSELTGKTADEIDQIMRADHVRNKPLIECIRAYKKDYKIALLTNVGSGLIDQLIPPDEQAELFDVVVESNQLQTIKPYPEIYEYTIAKLELEPQECLMIDDLERNIDGAEAVGMQGIVFHTVSQLEHDLCERGVTYA